MKPRYIIKMTGTYQVGRLTGQTSLPWPLRALVHVHSTIDVNGRTGDVGRSR